MEFQDKSLSCADCGQTFTFTAGEQEFYERKGFKEIPKRCKPCRESRKMRRADSPSNGHRDYGARNGSGSEANGNVAPRGSRELFDAVCARCGQAARVPFRPVAGRPVFCRDCYAAQRAGG
jgi:CxxC-x17-CxxC domain-containing protein